MRVIVTVMALSAVAALALAQDRPNFTGNWVFDASKSELRNVKLTNATWTIQQAEDEDSIHIKQDDGNKTIELKCTTDGKDCEVTGEKAKASFWYNGPVLVEMELKSEHAVRYQLKISEDGKTMRVETTQIVPKTDGIDVLVFTKQS
jgi:hypothetical protein